MRTIGVITDKIANTLFYLFSFKNIKNTDIMITTLDEKDLQILDNARRKVLNAHELSEQEWCEVKRILSNMPDAMIVYPELFNFLDAYKGKTTINK